MTALEAQKKSLQWSKEGGQYIPNPTTWLNQERWEDELRSNNVNTEFNEQPNSRTKHERDFKQQKSQYGETIEV